MDMLRLQTPVTDEKCKVGISYKDKILMLGSCFSDSIGKHLQDYGFDVMVNPFGTLYNPISILQGVRRLAGLHGGFDEDDCVQIGAGDERWCSFSHHTSFARGSKEEFLDNANARLSEARTFFSSCSKVIITLGTSWCFRHVGTGSVVSNCLKRPAAEFVRERLSSAEVTAALLEIASLCNRPESPTDASAHPKQIILTVSPIRHFKDGAHGNQLSKSALLLGIDDFLAACSADFSLDPCCPADYFPSYEILMDELRDYRFYAEDMCHPSSQTVCYIRDRFIAWALPSAEQPRLEENIRAFKRRSHRI